MGEWYYIGTYGQLGPLTRDQIAELIEGGVISRDTFVWKVGMPDWVPAERAPEMAALFVQAPPQIPPPPPSLESTRGMISPPAYGTLATPQYAYPVIPSDKNRTTAAFLQIIPGFGRLYLGYGAFGALQFLLMFCGGVGLIWSIIDGILILSGNVKHDGYGRALDP